MAKRSRAKPRKGARHRAKKDKRRKPAPPSERVMDQPFEASIADVRLAVKLLRRAALTPIPDLDEVAPERYDGFDAWGPHPPSPVETGKEVADAKARSEWERKYDEWAKKVCAWDRKHGWSERARKRASEAFDWRDELTKRIGRTSVENRRARDSDWDDDRLTNELGYRVVNSEATDYYPGWGPPESLLGEFYEPTHFGESGEYRLHVPAQYADMVRLLEAAAMVEPGTIKADTEHLQSHPFWEISPHFSRNDDARAILGVPPRHLTEPSYRRLDRRIVSGAGSRYLKEDEFIHPFKWQPYAEVILQQCLLERARALELCAWCDERIEAWEGAFYPTIRIGPYRRSRRRYDLSVTIAGQNVPLPDNSITPKGAERLLSLGGGKTVEFDYRKYATDLLKWIPPLRGLLTNQGSDTTGGRYRLPAEVTIIEVHEENDEK